MTPLSVIITIAAYFAILFTVSYIAGRKADNAGFFVGNRKSSWYVVAFAMVGSAISGVTYVSVPGMVAASSFGYLLALEQVPESIAKAILSVTSNKYLVLLLINLFLLVVGALMEPAAATIILTPILAPIAVKLGVDLVHFGLVMTVNLAIGFITPPVGSNLFVASATSGLKVESIARAAIPMIILMIAVLFILTYVPAISLFLPNHMM